MSYPTGTVALSFGNVQYAWTEAAHVHISTSNGNYVNVRGVEYHIGLHLYLIEGEWKLRDYRELYISRPSHDKHYNKPASESARKHVIEQCTAFWMGFVAGNPMLGHKAERSHLQDNVERLEEEIIEIESTLDAKRTLLRMAMDNLEAIPSG